MLEHIETILKAIPQPLVGVIVIAAMFLYFIYKVVLKYKPPGDLSVKALDATTELARMLGDRILKEAELLTALVSEVKESRSDMKEVKEQLQELRDLVLQKP